MVLLAVQMVPMVDKVTIKTRFPMAVIHQRGQTERPELDKIARQENLKMLTERCMLAVAVDFKAPVELAAVDVDIRQATERPQDKRTLAVAVVAAVIFQTVTAEAQELVVPES